MIDGSVKLVNICKVLISTVVLSRGDFIFQRTFDNVKDIFGCHDLGEGCYWHLVNRGQR